MKLVIISLGVVVAIAGAIMLGLHAGSPPATTKMLPTSSVAHLSRLQQPTTNLEPHPPDERSLISQMTGASQGAASATPPAEPEGPSGPAKIEAWLASSTDIPTVANAVLAGFPSLKPEDQLFAASKLVALVSDDRFDGLKRLLLDPKTTTAAKEFLFRDALSRAESLKLPLLMAIMQMPDHPCAAEARETLKTQLGVDYGVNYGQWQAKISEVLRAQQ